MTKRAVEYEVEKVRLGRHLSRSAVRQLLTDQAEYGGWELTRLRRYRDGTRDVWIRRKIIRQPAQRLSRRAVTDRQLLGRGVTERSVGAARRAPSVPGPA